MSRAIMDHDRVARAARSSASPPFLRPPDALDYDLMLPALALARPKAKRAAFILTNVTAYFALAAALRGLEFRFGHPSPGGAFRDPGALGDDRAPP
ncbi:MAG TPA: hypothetical protein VN718_07540 [Rhizomicrobium sp.]|nr:hypothetical protein [Rhizomicrobium sp.]